MLGIHTVGNIIAKIASYNQDLNFLYIPTYFVVPGWISAVNIPGLQKTVGCAFSKSLSWVTKNVVFPCCSIVQGLEVAIQCISQTMTLACKQEGFLKGSLNSWRILPVFCVLNRKDTKNYTFRPSPKLWRPDIFFQLKILGLLVLLTLRHLSEVSERWSSSSSLSVLLWKGHLDTSLPKLGTKVTVCDPHLPFHLTDCLWEQRLKL